MFDFVLCYLFPPVLFLQYPFSASKGTLLGNYEAIKVSITIKKNTYLQYYLGKYTNSELFIFSITE